MLALLGAVLGHLDLRNFLAREFFNRDQKAFFIEADQIHCMALATRAACTANAVHIVFADIRDFVVHDMRQFFDIDTAGGNIGCD